MTVRPYQTGDENQILALFEKVFNKKMDERVWKWKYLSSPDGLEPIILVFEEDGAILGHTALWVHPFSLGNQTGKAGLRIDTMVDPATRGRGIYKQLNEHIYQEAKKKNINLLYGFPAEKAKELQIKYIGSYHLANINRWMYMNKPITAISSKIKPLKFIKFLDPIYSATKRFFLKQKKDFHPNITEVERFDQKDSLPQIKEGIHLLRSREYLTWRYFDHPNKNYKVLQYKDGDQVKGYIIYKVFQNEQKLTIGLILDIIAFGKDKTLIKRALLRESVLQMKDAAFIQAWTMPNQGDSKIYKKTGFFLKDEPMPVVINEILNLNIDAKNPDNWFLAMGDVDSF